MAIEKMKKLRLVAVRSQKEPLLRDLMVLGCVQVTEPAQEMSDPSLSAVMKRENSNLTRCRSQHASLATAVELIDRYAPAKSKLLSAKPEVACDAFLDDSSIEGDLELAGELTGCEERIKRISAEESRQRAVIESLKPWEELDMPLECAGTEKTYAATGMLPAAADFGAVQAAVASVTEEAELFLVSADKTQQYVVLICMKDDQPAIQEALRQFAYAASALSGLTGTAKENIALGEKALTDLAAEKEALAEKIAAHGDKRSELKLCADRMSTKIAAAEAEDRLYGMSSSVALEGWVPEASVDELSGVLEKYDCAWETEDPLPEEYPEVPVKLRSNKLTNALNMVTNMYSLPAYDGIDPNPLIAPFFILFYGLMMADMGYGILMIVAAAVAIKKIKPKGGTLSFCQLLLYAGISTFIMGAITGGFFGDALEQIGKILNLGEGWGKLPSLFSPLNDSMAVLIGAMVLGVIQLNTGLVISFVEKCKRGEVLDGVFYECSLWIVLAGIIMVVLKTGLVGKIVLIVGLVMLFYGGTRGKKGFAKVTSLFGTLYNEAPGWFGDILSYSRIMALMLAGSVIAMVFNMIGAITGNIVGFIIVFLIGHTLNFLLNLLSCYVHDLRLQCLEYFGKFYKDGGKPFRPLEVKTKYYNVVE